MIPGIIAIPSGISKNVIFQGVHTSTVNSSSYTFSSVNLGAPDTGRIIVIGVNYYEYDTTANITSLTVAGNAATARVTNLNDVPGGTGSFIYASIWSLTLASGSTGSVVINLSGGALGLDRGCSIGVWSLYNMSSSTPQATDAADSNTAGVAASLTTTAQANDAIIAVATGASNAGSTTWTNITEEYDVLGNNLQRSGASRLVLNDGTVNINVTNASGQLTSVLARWR